MNIDPSGTFAITAFIIALIVGAAVGAAVGGAVAYSVAKSNGATGWGLFGWTLLGMFGGAVIGGALGAAIGLAAPAIGAAFSSALSTFSGFLSSSFILGMSASGGAIAISGAQITGLAALLALIVLFASNGRPKNNSVQDKQYRDAAREAGLDVNDPSVLDDLQEVHRYIRKNKLNLGFKDLVNLIKDFFDLI